MKPVRSTFSSPAADTDERLRAAIKVRDMWWATVFSGPVANRIIRTLCHYPRVHPNHVTLLGLGVAILAAICLALGNYPFTVAGALLVQAAFILDCVDGQLARYRGETSTFGAILDRVLDRVKPPLYLLALAWGAHGRAAPETLLLAAFIGSMGFFLVDLYRQQFFLLIGAGGSAQGSGANPRVALPLRALDLPFVRLNGGDHVFLLSLLCLLDQRVILLLFVAAVSLVQIVFRPVYYLQSFRETYGTWPWRAP